MRAAFSAVLAAVVVVALAPVPAAAGPAPADPPAATSWTAPLPGDLAVTRPFEAPAHAYGPGHRGADLGAAAGTPVLAAGDGVVAFAGMVAGRPVVSIDHADGLRTTYEPVDPAVGAGQRVTRGSPIGVLVAGHAGCPVEACLHWGLRRGGEYLDPLMLLVVRVRLLPLRSARGPTTRSRRARAPGTAGGRPPTGGVAGAAWGCPTPPPRRRAGTGRRPSAPPPEPRPWRPACA